MKTGLSKSDFERVYSSGKRLSGRLFRLISLPGQGRVGFSTSRSVGNTPRRNRLKRRFRAALMASAPLLPADHDVVIAIHASADQAAYADIAADVADVLKRAHEQASGEPEPIEEGRGPDASGNRANGDG